MFSAIGFIKTDTLISPKVYIPLKNSGKVHILGIVATTMLLAYLVLLVIISKWFNLLASIPAGAIKSFRVSLLFSKKLFFYSICCSSKSISSFCSCTFCFLNFMNFPPLFLCYFPSSVAVDLSVFGFLPLLLICSFVFLYN